ncbi:MAG: hypothetical protein RLZZ458_2228 [Planctomycetota bacterium]
MKINAEEDHVAPYCPASCLTPCSHDTMLLTQRSLLNRESESFGRDFRRAEGSRGVSSASRICAENERLAGAGGPFRNAAKNRDPTKNAERDTLGVLVNQTVGESSLTGFSSSGRTRTYDPAVNSRLLYQLSYRGMCWRFRKSNGENSGNQDTFALFQVRPILL